MLYGYGVAAKQWPHPPFFGGRFYRAIETHYTCVCVCVCVCVMRARLVAERVRLLTESFSLSLNWLRRRI